MSLRSTPLNGKNRIVILGGSGFIGSFLIDKLLKKGNKNILNISSHGLETSVHIQEVLGDISNKSLMNDSLNTGDIVVYLAESIIPGTSETQRLGDITKNITSLLGILDLCVEKNTSKFIYISSGGAIYGKGNTPFIETSPSDPVSSYGVMKLAAEKYIGVYNHLYDLKSIVIRPSNPYGRIGVLKNRSAVDTFIQKNYRGETIEIWGDGNIIRDYIHIEDLVEFISNAVTSVSMQGVYNVGTGIGTSLTELISTIERVSGTKSKIEYKNKRPQDVEYNVLNVQKAFETDWHPKINLEDGIKEIYANIKPQ